MQSGPSKDCIPKVLRCLREAEGSLWHLRADLLGWKMKLDSLINNVDNILSHVLGLGHMFTEGLNAGGPPSVANDKNEPNE